MRSLYIGIISAVIMFYTIMFTFDLIFKETPVNLMHIGGKDGYFNYVVNVLSYGILTYLVILLVHYLLREYSKEYSLGVRLGIMLSIILSPIVVIIVGYIQTVN